MLKSFSAQPPPRFEIIRESGDDMCTVMFYTDVRARENTRGDMIYSANVLTVCVKYELNLTRDIIDNYSEWLYMAAELETVATVKIED